MWVDAVFCVRNAHEKLWRLWFRLTHVSEQYWLKNKVKKRVQKNIFNDQVIYVVCLLYASFITLRQIWLIVICYPLAEQAL